MKRIMAFGGANHFYREKDEAGGRERESHDFGYKRWRVKIGSPRGGVFNSRVPNLFG